MVQLLQPASFWWMCRLKTFDTKHFIPELENPVGGNLGFFGSVLP